MIFCSENCMPCCDFCIYCIHEKIPYNRKVTNGEPIGCSKHSDEEYKLLVKHCGYCNDFHCFNTKQNKD